MCLPFSMPSPIQHYVQMLWETEKQALSVILFFFTSWVVANLNTLVSYGHLKLNISLKLAN